MNVDKYIIIETSACHEPDNSGIKRILHSILNNIEKSGWTVHQINYKSYSKNHNYLKLLYYYNLLLKKYLKKELCNGTELFLVPNNMSKFYSLPHKRTVFIIHDLIPLESKVGYTGLRKLVYRYKLKLLKSAHGYIAISNTVAKQLAIEAGISSEKISVVYDALSPSFYDNKCNVSSKFEDMINNFGDFILAIGTGEPRKNVDLILDNIKQTYGHYKLKLVLFGGNWHGNGYSSVISRIKKLQVEDLVLHVGRVTDDELKFLYQRCKLFIYPSVAEGFGLPPLEALSQGAKLLLSNLEVFKEIYSELSTMFELNNNSEFIDKIGSAIEKQVDENLLRSFLGRYNESNYVKNLDEALTKYLT